MISQIISHYRILEKLRGGRTEFVYVAQDHAALERFREAKSTSTLDHPGICSNADVSILKQAKLGYAKLQ